MRISDCSSDVCSSDRELGENPTGAGLSVVVNIGAGSAGDIVELLEDRLPDSEIVVLDDPSELPNALEAAATGEIRVLGVAGGDGSINTAAGIAAEHGLPLLALPGGSLNHLARDLGITSVEDAAAALAAGTAVEVDLPTTDGRPFLNTASFENGRAHV